MIKKFLISILFIFVALTHSVFAQDVFKVTSVNFDTSNSMIFLTSPDNTTEAIMKNVKLIKLQNPKRVYFDIDSAILTASAQNWFLNSGGVKQIKISQFSTNPAKIRAVFYLDEDFDQSKITFLRVNNNLVIKFKNGVVHGNYYQHTYTDSPQKSSQFYENLSISSEDFNKIKIAVDAKNNDKMLNQIQDAFNLSNAPSVAVNSQNAKSIAVINKELRLKSKFYCNSVSTKPFGVLISGYGAISVEKPMYLTNPARVIFDIPNAIINPGVAKTTYKSGVDIINVDQFSSNKLRVTIKTNTPEKYFPIFSSDLQSILFTAQDEIDPDSLFNKITDATSFSTKRIDANSEEFTVNFHSPVVHSIKREPSQLVINFYNALRYNDADFKHSIQSSGLDCMKMDLLPKIGLKLVIPLEKNSIATCTAGADGKSIKVIIKGVKKRVVQACQPQDSVRNIVLPKASGGKRCVVIDAGHGGSDYGAIRAGINEKDINLDVAKKVQALLLAKGFTVYMSRPTDDFVSLQDRTNFSADKSPDIFVSIHVNSSVKPEISGLETHYYHQESLELAQTVHSSLVSYVHSKDRGLFKSKFYVINHTSVPAILVEIGFISNAEERAELVSEKRKQDTAKAISEGILKYLNRN